MNEMPVMSQTREEVECAVLGMYRKVNPSFVDIADPEKYKLYTEQRENLLRGLCLPKQLFAGKKLIDVGGGTGEKTLFYSLWGAEVTLLEPNESSCQKTQELFRRNNRNVMVMDQSLYDTDPVLFKSFDIVVCDGVLHHTYDPLAGLTRILGGMEEGAVVIIGLGEYHGWFKRNLQRELVRAAAGGDEEKIPAVAKQYFQEHIDRAVRFGLRTEETVIADTFINPQIQCPKLEDICGAFFQQRITYLSAYPTLTCFYQTTPWTQPKENRFNYEHYWGYYQFLEKVWMTCGEEAVAESLASFSFERIKERIESESAILLSKPFPESHLSLIQKGYLGVGHHYFAGIKDRS